MGRKDDIKDYLRGNRKGRAANRLEREALSDPFLFEALEGLTTTPGDPIDGLIRLERHLDERARSSRKKNRGWLYIAASILVVAMCGTLWYMQTGKETVEPQMALLRAPMQMAEDSSRELRSSGTAGNLDSTSGSLVKDSSVDAVAKQQFKNRSISEVSAGKVMEMMENTEEIGTVTVEQDTALALTKAKVMQNVVEGVVTDERGNPLPGVTVLVTGTNLGVVTDAQGLFRLSVPEKKAHLMFQFVGMKTQGVSVVAGEKIQVKMNEDAKGLEEVVVTGYQKVAKREMLGSVATIQIDTNAIASLDDVTHFNRYMERALQYPKEDLEKDNEGVIYVSFELNKKNTPSRIRIKDGFSKESNKELIRLLSNGPKWDNSRIGVRIHAIVRFTIGKDGARNKAVLTIEKQKK